MNCGTKALSEYDDVAKQLPKNILEKPYAYKEAVKDEADIKNEPMSLKDILMGIKSVVIAIIGGILIIVIIFCVMYFGNEVSVGLFNFSLVKVIFGICAVVFVICVIVRWYQRLIKGEW